MSTMFHQLLGDDRNSREEIVVQLSGLAPGVLGGVADEPAMLLRGSAVCRLFLGKRRMGVESALCMFRVL